MSFLLTVQNLTLLIISLYISKSHLLLNISSALMALSIFFFSLFLFLFSNSPADAESFIGVNYGLLADNLPSPSDAAKLLQSTSIQKVRLYGADPTIIKSLAGTGVGIVIGVANGDLPSLASDLNVASQWIGTNVLPFLSLIHI